MKIERLAPCRLAMFFSFAALSGCASFAPDRSLRPHLPTGGDTNVVSALRTLAGKADPTMDQAEELVRGLRDGSWTLAVNANDQRWNQQALSVFGGGAAVLGETKDRVGLRNVGLLLSVLGLTSTAYYDPESTKKVHLAGYKKLGCILDAIGGLQERHRQNAIASSAAGSLDAADAPVSIARQAEAVMTQYRLAVLDQKPGNVSREDFLRFSKEYSKSEIEKENALDTAAKKKAGLIAADPDLARQMAEVNGDVQKLMENTPNLADPQKTAKRFKANSLLLADKELDAARFVGFETRLELCTKEPVTSP